MARKVGTTPSNFNQKMKRASFTMGELEKMAEILGVKYFCGFEFEDGTRV